MSLVCTFTVPIGELLVDSLLFVCSIGGVIGTGLFLGTAGSLENGGPVGLLLGYSVVGTITYCVMISLGEMIAYLPIPGGHIALAERFVDPAFAFTMVSGNSPNAPNVSGVF